MSPHACQNPRHVLQGRVQISTLIFPCMPIKTSAKKYMRVSARKAIRNKTVKGVVKSAIKKTRESAKAGNIEEAQTSLKAALKALDKAAEKNIIKKNTAARKKSRLNKLVKESVKK